VLIISTDPAHNVSDAFNQAFTKTPTPVKGMDNLDAMEVDPSVVTKDTDYFSEWNLEKAVGTMEDGQSIRSVVSILRQAATTLPGIDEVTVFVEIMREVKRLRYDVVVFDTAPTGHTLRLLALPSTLNESVDRLMEVQGLSGLLSAATQFVGNATGMTSDEFMDKLAKWRAQVKEVQGQFTDHSKTLFVCVCIPEFLSVYETERLVQELSKYNIGCEHIVVNQLVKKPKSEPSCRMCDARMRIQAKYMQQVFELYEDFNVVQMPLLGDEVRGVTALTQFSNFLVTPYDPDVHGYL
jgi:arsenite-transporting ATPase